MFISELDFSAIPKSKNININKGFASLTPLDNSFKKVHLPSGKIIYISYTYDPAKKKPVNS